MHKTVSILLLFGLALVLVAACAPEPPPPPPEEDEEPPEPTPEEYRTQLRGMMGQLLQPGMPAGPDEAVLGIIAQLPGRRTQLMATENGRQALQLITRDVEDAIRTAREEERWHKISALCRIFRVFQPDNTRFEKIREYADLMIQRPVLTITGFMELDDELYVFIDLFDPTDGETTSYRVREGEEFHSNMRLIRIVGNQLAIEVEYLPLEFEWQVDGPKERARGGRF